MPKLYLESIIATCEKLTEDLEEINPAHRLLRYNTDGLSDEALDVMTNSFYHDFCPDRLEGNLPNDWQMIRTFESYRDALQAGIVVEKAKCGFYTPR